MTNAYNFLDSELQSFKKSAGRGYAIAKEQHAQLSNTIQKATDQVQDVLAKFNKSKYKDSSVTETLGNQLSDISRSFGELEYGTMNDLLKLKGRLSMFSITLFGRTMAGKSTMMEYLVNGNGDSIGKGAQRTTRDVRTYQWNDLSITDVPGIGAFEGQEDETIAFDAAKNADVILFLLTDDAPQYEEAECLSRIVNLGKPVIIILNIKFAIRDDESAKMIMRDMQEKFNRERIDSIARQFYNFASKFGQDWKNIPIIPVQLHAAFKSQKTSDRELKSLLYEASRIEVLQETIVKAVRRDGDFFRIKNFIDTIDNPMLSFMEILLEQSNSNRSQGRLILAKKRNLEKWKDSFFKSSQNRIKAYIAGLKSRLMGEVASFSEAHYGDSNVNEAWGKILSAYDIDRNAKELMDGIEKRCNDHINEIAREIANELEFSNHIVANASLNMERIVDSKRIWIWSTALLSGGLTVLAIITGTIGLACTGPIGWAAAIVGGVGTLVSFLLTDKTTKINDARKKMEALINANIADICSQLEKKLGDYLDKIMAKRIEVLVREMQRILNVLFSLGDEQKKLAWKIQGRIASLNERFLEASLQLAGFDGIQYHVRSVARIPGQAILLVLPEGTVIPRACKEKLQSLTREEVLFTFENANKRQLLAQVVGGKVDRKRIRIEENIGIAHVPIEKKDLYLIRRVRLAQQLVDLLITK